MSIPTISYKKMFQVTDSFFKAQFDDERNIARLSQILASNFQIVSTGIAFTAELDEYLKIMEEKHYNNLIGKVNYILPLQHFPGEDTGTIRWKIEVLQHRLGKGLNEEGEGS